MSKIRYFISGHGLGHASRSCQIVNTLRRLHPEVAVEVVSDAHDWFFRGFLAGDVARRRQTLDIGVRQRDSLHMDEAETLAAYRRFLPERERLVAQEAQSLRRAQVSLVVADIPPLAFAAARAAGIPGVGVANFTWDWIYRGLGGRYPGFGDVLASVSADYRQADLFLRLPFHGDFPAGVPVEDLPLVARRAQREPAAVRAALGIAPGQRIALISFGGFGLSGFDFAPLGRLSGWTFLSEAGLSARLDNLRVVPAGAISYPDLVAAADVVVTKPGYGIVSEAIVNDAAVLYTSRGDFREQALLVEGLRRYGRAREISNARLLAGDWGEDLTALLAGPRAPDTLVAGGDIVAAGRLAALAHGAA